MERSIAASSNWPRRRMLSRIAAYFWSKGERGWVVVIGHCPLRGEERSSSEASRDVILRHFHRRTREDILRDVELDQLAQPKQAGAVGDARGLLHDVGD